jgi:hypothetical protein
VNLSLGKLEKVRLRDFWLKEDRDFTPWLANEQNISILSEAIGIELEVQNHEENVGPFRADILCLDTANNHYVLIENQLERTDHVHLGQLMTYAAGLDAVTIIWISSRFTEEHRAALDWLNRITDDTFSFFGIEIELYRIGDSLPAPMFNVVAKPNDWAKSVKKTASTGNITETKLAQQEYWMGLKEYVEEAGSAIKMQKPLPQHWTNVAIGKSNFYLSPNVSAKEKGLSIWFCIEGPNAKPNFDKLHQNCYEQSMVMFGDSLVWDRKDARKMSAVVLNGPGDFNDKKDRVRQFDWFKTNLEKLTRFFRPEIERL